MVMRKRTRKEDALLAADAPGGGREAGEYGPAAPPPPPPSTSSRVVVRLVTEDGEKDIQMVSWVSLWCFILFFRFVFQKKKIKMSFCKKMRRITVKVHS